MTVVLALAAFAVSWFAMAWLAVGVHRSAKPALDAVASRARAALLFALALLPFAVAALVAVLGFAPAIGGWVVDDHCHPATGCTTHVPALHAEALYAAGLAFVAAGASGGLLWAVARRLRRSLRTASMLRFLAERDGGQPFEIIESREPFAYCIGLLRPKVVLSRGLVERLPAAQLQAVLRHERAHAARRDNLRAWLAGLGLLPVPTRAKQPLLADLALAAEQACDRAAAAAGHNATVIEALAALAPGVRANDRRTLATFDSPTTMTRRIAALERDDGRKLSPLAVCATVALAYGACAVLATDLIHHAIEVVLELF